MILTDEEIDVMSSNAPAVPDLDGYLDFARAIEAAVITKIKERGPVGIVDDEGVCWSACGYVEGKDTPLYALSETSEQLGRY